uniref:Nardilysin b (N-arginine dibasic convertase) n=1 Tax=Petromyzon marinus TaxID=7757 RepID=S4RDH1_PETMA
YPCENSLDDFLRRHGGSDNAGTDCEHTTYTLDQNTYLQLALHRWAQFFISPLMKRERESMEREVQTVDREFHEASGVSDGGTLAKTSHTMGQLFWGNSASLLHSARAHGLDAHAALRQFHQRHYSACRMTLAVQSRESLDQLEEWVTEIFSKMPNNGLTRVDFSSQGPPFEMETFHKLYRVPVKKLHILHITWSLPPLSPSLHRVKPLTYLYWLLGHEGEGSVTATLRQRLWATSLSCGNSESGFEQNSTHCLFSFRITLTDIGMDNFYPVVHVVFQYLKMLQQLRPQERSYREIQHIEANDFRFQNQEEPIDTVENLFENLQRYAAHDVIVGDQLLMDYQPEVIAAATDLMTPGRANLLLLSPNHAARSDHVTEGRFNTRYSVEDIDLAWVDLWTGYFPLSLDLHLPELNPYIGTDFSLVGNHQQQQHHQQEEAESDYPWLIACDGQGSLWYKLDRTFLVPKAYLNFQLISPLIQESAENQLLLDLMVMSVSHCVSTRLYPASVARLHYRLSAGDRHLGIHCSGHNHTLPLLFRALVLSPSQLVFDAMLEQIRRSLHNAIIKPDKLGRDVRLCLLETERRSLSNRLFCATNATTTTTTTSTTNATVISAERLREFARHFLASVRVQGLAQGNLTAEEAFELMDFLCEKVGGSGTGPPLPLTFRVSRLPEKCRRSCRLASRNHRDSGSDVTVYYQFGPCTIRENVLMELLVMHMEEPCFDFLRTKHSLGYHVYAMCRCTSGILGLSINVSCQSSKHSTSYVESKIEGFLSRYEVSLSHLTQDDFKSQVNALVSRKRCEDSHLGQEVEHNWEEVLTGQLLFCRVQKEVEALMSLRCEELSEFFSAVRRHRRILSIHVIGSSEVKGEGPEVT